MYKEKEVMIMLKTAHAVARYFENYSRGTVHNSQFEFWEPLFSFFFL